jgi:hypothetical protein
MASAQNKIEVDDFEGFQFLVFNEDDYLYIRITNNESLSLYEKMIEETDLTDYGNIFDLNELYLFFSNVFNHENESQYKMIIETSTDFLEICLKKKVGDQFLVQTRIHIPKIFSESEKQKELLSEIDNRHRDEVSSVSSMKQLEIDSLEERIRNIQEEHQREIQRIRKEHQMEIQRIREEIIEEEKDTVFVPFGRYKPNNYGDHVVAYVPRNVVCLSIEFEYQPLHGNWSHYSCGYTRGTSDSYSIKIYSDCGDLLNLLRNLNRLRKVKINFSMTNFYASYIQRIRDYCSSKGIQLDMR